MIYEHDEAQERRADKKRSNEELVKNTLERHPLPVSFYDSKYSWCIIDLDKYLADVRQDVEELEEAGDYAFYADTILKDDQFDALDSAKFLQGNLVLLVGSNRFVTDNFNDLRKGAGTTIVHPFYEKISFTP